MRDFAADLPVLLDLDLLSSGWDGTISPYPGMPVKVVAIQSLRSAFLKKFQDSADLEKANSNALKLFIEINEKCRVFRLPGPSEMSEIEAIALGEAKDFIYRFFYNSDQSCDSKLPYHVLNWDSISKGYGFGNGSNIGSFGTDFLSKVGTSLMSATSTGLHVLFKQGIASDPLWSSVESRRQEYRESTVVRGSRLSFVPKTSEISRTICTEPVLNMLFQKGIGAVLEGRLRQICGIDLSNQPDKNRILARLGSEDGRFGTIDLSSASDSMSLTLVNEMFPKYVANILGATRCPVTILPDGSEVALHMVSSMGNAFTFPLQTIFFSAVVHGVYKALDIPIHRPSKHSLGNFAVFGDDIIVTNKAYGLMVKMLSICGFSVNVNKSFNTGLFRESCGHDYYSGYNVRGVYLKTLLTSGDRYSAINRLNRWSAQWGIKLCNTIAYLLKGLRLLPIPLDEMDDGGVKVPLRSVERKKFNKFTGGVKYRVMAYRPISYDLSDVESRPPRLRGWFPNHNAVLLAAVAGTLRAGRVVIRSNVRRQTSIKVRYSSSWDYIPPTYAEMRRIGERWKSFIELNLSIY
jgi:hypothetical protein